MYRYDPLNKINFHNYIDNKTDLLLVLKLVNGSILGGYSYEEVNILRVPGKGFIYSLTNQFILNVTNKNSRQAKVITPDDLNLIFGNSELRIKVNGEIVFSNLGVLNAYFNDKEKGVKVGEFLGEGEGVREAKLETYEFYQLSFA